MSIKNAIALLIIVIILVGAMLFITYKIGERNKFYNHNALNQEKTIDSLNSELFILQTQVARYEITLDLLEEQDKLAADKFKKILSTQTE
jgi:uncharacterized coiled-coil protein SlyX